MSLYDGKTLEADYSQLIEDNLRKLELERIAKQNQARIDQGYFQVIDGRVWFIKELQPESRVNESAQADKRYRDNLELAKKAASKRQRQWQISTKR